MLNFEPGWHVRGVFASFLGTDFNRTVKILIFGLFGGSGAILGTLRGNCWGQDLKLLNFDPRKQVRGVFALFLGADFNRGVKTLIFGLFLGGQGLFLVPLGVPPGVKN